MTVLRLLGGMLILFSGGMAAFCSVRYERLKISVLDGWLDLIFYIRTQIDCYLTPLGEILANADPGLFRACMYRGRPSGLNALLESTRFYTDAETHRLLRAFIKELGSSYREEQVRRCDYYISVLRGIRDRQMAELPARQKVRATLCACAAAGALILLW